MNVAASCNFATVTYNHAVVQLYVVADVYTFHDEVVSSDDSLPAGMCGAVDDHVLTDNVVVAYNKFRIFTLEIKILRYGSQYGALVHCVAPPHAGSVHDADEWKDAAAVTYDDVALYIGERHDSYVFTYLSLGIYEGLRTDILHCSVCF